MHESSAESIEKKTKINFSDIANEIGLITRYTIFSTCTFRSPSGLYYIDNCGNFVNGVMFAVVKGSFECSGEVEHPSGREIPSVSIEMIPSFGS